MTKHLGELLAVARRSAVQPNRARWDNKLYKTDIPIPRKLLNHGKPVKLDDMTEAQRDIYREWREGDSDRPNVAYLETGKEKLKEVRRAAEQLDILDRCLGDIP